MGIIKNFKENKNAKNEIKEKVRTFIIEGSKINLAIESQGLSQELKAKMESLMSEIDSWMSQICKTKGPLSKEDEEQKELLMSEALHMISLAIDRETSYQKRYADFAKKSNEHYKGIGEGKFLTPREIGAMRKALDDEEQWAILGRSQAAHKVVVVERFCRSAKVEKQGTEGPSRG